MSEFEQLLQLIEPLVRQILNEQESDKNLEKPLDFQVIPSIHGKQKKGVCHGRKA